MAHFKQLFLDIIEAGGEPPFPYEGPFHQKAEFQTADEESESE